VESGEVVTDEPTIEIAAFTVRILRLRFPEATDAELADACSHAFVWFERAPLPGGTIDAK